MSCKVIAVLSLFLVAICFSQEIDDHCDCNELETQLQSLNFINSYANEMVSGVFYQRVEPRETLKGGKEIIYYNEEVANLLDLDLQRYIENSHCKNILLEYLSFEKKIPGSDPISVPHSE